MRYGKQKIVLGDDDTNDEDDGDDGKDDKNVDGIKGGIGGKDDGNDCIADLDWNFFAISCLGGKDNGDVGLGGKGANDCANDCVGSKYCSGGKDDGKDCIADLDWNIFAFSCFFSVLSFGLLE